MMTPGSAPLLGREQLTRYSRQLVLPEVGISGQRRLLEARVLVVGAGGLGSPAALYLAAAGVGTIGIVDGDRVDPSNLHRQLLHRTGDVGSPKTTSAARTLREINPEVTVVAFPVVLSSSNALEIIEQFNVVVNCSDNFPTRYLVNDACVLLRRPLVDASVLRWEGQATVYLPGRGCYRCLFPSPPPPGVVPSCAEAGIVGAVAGLLGTNQAIEVLKLLLGAGEGLANRLMLVDALSGETRTVRWNRNPQCPVCGDHPTITSLINYEEFCGLPGRPQAPSQPPASIPVPEVDPRDAATMLEQGAQMIDVREPWEWVASRIPGARLIPAAEVCRRASEIDPNRPVIVHCTAGGRGAGVVETLRKAGYTHAYNLAGGIIAWANLGLPTEVGPTAE